MFINNFDPVAIEIFSLEIRWYSLSYIAGIIIGWYLAKKIFIYNNIINKFDDYVTYVIIGLILGGRIGYILFYNLDYYLHNFFDISTVEPLSFSPVITKVLTFIFSNFSSFL